MKKFTLFLLVLFISGCSKHAKQDHQIITVKKATEAPILNGVEDDQCWENSVWLPLDQKWLGTDYTEKDFSGRYKLSWRESSLYLLVEIVDDSLFDQNKDPLKLWWDDDCVEVFIDEDNSGGGHQYTHNAFAYHVALDGNVVDIAPDKEPRLYNDHVVSKRTLKGDKSIWELSIKLYDDSFMDGKENIPVSLEKGKKIGFALAYCDNDASKERENFIGSVFVPGEDKNQGWINADIFGTLQLEE
ncbi:sugar-binding protein [Ascidiimonas sp. W6]|uniref:sugar-binding protein n=1 Tax=Ascidiimonas meishanensis TaxID=3128903 RepID=UPI0030EF7B00